MLHITSVEQNGALTSDGRFVSWQSLKDAAAPRKPSDRLSAADAAQDDAIRAAYVSLLAQAQALAEQAGLCVEVRRDSTNVWWVVSVFTVCGEFPVDYRRQADEGGTHCNEMLASCEASDICERLGSKVQQRKFDISAKEKARRAQATLQ